MSIGGKISQKRKERGLTQAELGEKCGASKQTIYKYEKEVITNIPLDVLEKIAQALGVTPGYLMGWEDQQPNIPGVAAAPAASRKPRLGSIACGSPILAEQNLEGFDAVPYWVDCDFTLQCRGDSMINARIFDGDIVCIRSQPQVENGEIAAVLVGEEATLKRVHLFPDHIVLEPENPMYKPLVFWGDEMKDVRILGKATHFISTVR